MTRTMGDAIHDNVGALARAKLQMVAGYVTGSPDILWTNADWALFPGLPHVTIDQGFTGSPVASAIVRDVEPGAWTAAAAVSSRPWTPARPTIYCSTSALPTLEQAGWRGDVWVANYVTSAPGSPYPVPAGMTCVAWQWTNMGGGGTYDLSVVFDPYWPDRPPATSPEAENMNAAQYSDGRQIVALIGTDGNVYVTEQPSLGSAWQRTGPVGGQCPVTGAVSLVLEVVSDMPSVFVQSANPPASGNGDVWTSWKQANGSWAGWAQIA
jgi:hypothetical protein